MLSVIAPFSKMLCCSLSFHAYRHCQPFQIFVALSHVPTGLSCRPIKTLQVRAGSMHSAWPKKTEVLFMDELRDITGRGGFEVSLFGPKNPLVLNINFLSRFFKRAFVGLR